MAKKSVKPTLSAIGDLPLPDLPDTRDVYKIDGAPYLFIRVLRDSKVFFYQRTIRRQQKKHTIGAFPSVTIADARKATEAYSARYALGEDVAETERKEKGIWTVGDTWQRYRAKNERKGGKSLQTLDTYWKLHFSKWQNRKLDTVSDGMADDLQNRLIEKRSGATVNRVIATARALFNFAIKSKSSAFDGPNPFNGLDKQPEKSRTQRIYRKQIPAFFAALEQVSPTMKDFILLAVYTGRRAGEIRSMRWVDVDLDSASWLIPDPKAGEPQVAALVPEAMEILLKRRRTVSGKWVFAADTAGGYMAKGGYRKAWVKVRDIAGLQGIRFHDLRRSVASIAFEMGASQQVVGEMLGHKDSSTTERIYKTISNEAQRQVAANSAKAWTEAAKCMTSAPMEQI